MVSYTPDRDVIDRGVEHRQRAEHLNQHVGFKASYRLNYFDIGYAFGYNIGAESNVQNTKDGQLLGFGKQRVTWFSNALGIYAYPLGNKGKLRPYLYAGGIFYASETTTSEFLNIYNVYNPAGEDITSGTIQWTSPARSAGFDAFGLQASVGLKYLFTEQFGINLAISTSSFQSDVPKNLPKHIQVYQAEIGLIFRTLKTKLPL